MTSRQHTTRPGRPDPTHPVGVSSRRRFALATAVVAATIGAAGAIGGGSASAIVDGEDTTAADNPWQVALTSADVPVVADADCSLLDAENGDDPDEPCAGGTGTDSCYGDSGGPLTVAPTRAASPPEW